MPSPKLKVVVEQDQENVIEKHVMQKAILDISKGITAIRTCGLLNKDIICLIQCRNRKLTKDDIESVLEAIDDLKKDYKL